MYCQFHTCVFIRKKIQQDIVGFSSDLGQKKSGMPLTKLDDKENGQSRWFDDAPSLPIH